MAITIFYNQYSPGADGEFRQWTRDFPDHVYLNQRGPGDYMIHFGRCPHLFHETQVRLTQSRKICAPAAEELRRLADEEEAEIAPCSTRGAHA